MKYGGKSFRKIEIDTEKEIFLIDGGKVSYESRMFGSSSFSDLKEYLDNNAEKERIKTAEETKKAMMAAFIEAFDLYGKLIDASDD